MSERPELIAIDHDDYHAEHVGRLPDGRQFFLTTPFEPAGPGAPGGEYVALYIFDAAGNILDTRIDAFGPRASMNKEARCEKYQDRLAELGEVSFERIEVKPFSVDRFGLQFGLVVREREDEDEAFAVELMPGNYMAFFEPWDSGEYDT